MLERVRAMKAALKRPNVIAEIKMAKIPKVRNSPGILARLPKGVAPLPMAEKGELYAKSHHEQDSNPKRRHGNPKMTLPCCNNQQRRGPRVKIC
jgi:hypothetical protein